MTVISKLRQSEVRAVIEGIKAAIFVLDKQEELSKERKMSMIESLKGVIAQSEEIYGEASTKH